MYAPNLGSGWAAADNDDRVRAIPATVATRIRAPRRPSGARTAPSQTALPNRPFGEFWAFETLSLRVSDVLGAFLARPA
jgi:hypothetical protein